MGRYIMSFNKDIVTPPNNENQYFNTNFHHSQAAPKTIWVVHDPNGGPHFFLTKRDAEKQYKQWKRQHLYEKNESFQKISKPLKYILDGSKRRRYLKMNAPSSAVG